MNRQIEFVHWLLASLATALPNLWLGSTGQWYTELALAWSDFKWRPEGKARMRQAVESGGRLAGRLLRSHWRLH